MSSSRLALRILRTRAPLITYRARATYATGSKTTSTGGKNTPPPAGKIQHDKWEPDLASPSEEAVKADREDFGGNEKLQELSKKVDEQIEELHHHKQPGAKKN
ncbi:hypothetical protein SAPIO_CDS7849 [Scedosporium apiospermum]|uniref:Uncharacterized protein n=1 Tax=Pseudallescheria apiosperma TaxID=563466 RepID=A0A084G0T9_PSEDA|nr:uncharacterized protein SAPIO_CDS7849 [Scedosporium apiospermum]KEZ40951.1 hypothetical protein SAPIO_CDS7849 [Scedosporium apiospermum]